MTAAILKMLPQRKGPRRNPGDPKHLLRLFPVGGSHGPTFIYAMAFRGGVVKVGKTCNPRQRLLTHWRTGAGEVHWVHLFGPMHPDAANRVERAVPRALGDLGRAVNKSEWFFTSAPRASIVSAIRPVIEECKREHEERMRDERERDLRAHAAERLLEANGFTNVSVTVHRAAEEEGA